MTDPVLFRTERTASGKCLGVVTLNAPKALNALSLDMIDRIHPQLLAWQRDPDIAGVWLEGEGEKAFCAGGDIVRMYEAMRDTPVGERVPYTEAFFEREYRLDYLLHTFGKPVICWGDGIVMGGGLGLMAGCSHRIVTETSRIAMPEITIGLHPDVGGSWFLSRMPGRTGLFLGLTGASLNARDALFVGLADRAVLRRDKDNVFAAILALALDDDVEASHRRIGEVVRAHQALTVELPESPVRRHLDLINELCDADALPLVVARITARDDHQDPWVARAAATLRKGCAQTTWLVWSAQQKVRHLSLADAFRMEWTMSAQCAMHEELREGIRALLIDKDGAPRFRFAKVEDVPEEWIAGFFVSPVVPHPLEDM